MGKSKSTELSFSNGTTVDLDRSEKAGKLFRAYNHKLRQKILKTIDEKRSITVTAIFTKLKIEQSVASQHLAILRKAGLVSTVRDGKSIIYSVNYAAFDKINGLITALLA